MIWYLGSVLYFIGMLCLAVGVMLTALSSFIIAVIVEQATGSSDKGAKAFVWTIIIQIVVLILISPFLGLI